jgi:hypothetical protein
MHCSWRINDTVTNLKARLKNLGYASGPKVGTFDENKRGRKSRATVFLRSYQRIYDLGKKADVVFTKRYNEEPFPGVGGV